MPALSILPWEETKFLYNHNKVSFVLEHVVDINLECTSLLTKVFSEYRT